MDPGHRENTNGGVLDNHIGEHVIFPWHDVLQKAQVIFLKMDSYGHTVITDHYNTLINTQMYQVSF